MSNDFTVMNTKIEIDLKIIENTIYPGNKKSYHMNCNNTMKAYRKYKCAMIKNGNNQKVSNLKKWI